MATTLSPGIGERAHEIRLQTAEETTFDLAQMAGRPVVISFLSHAA